MKQLQEVACSLNLRQHFRRGLLQKCAECCVREVLIGIMCNGTGLSVKGKSGPEEQGVFASA